MCRYECVYTYNQTTIYMYTQMHTYTHPYRRSDGGCGLPDQKHMQGPECKFKSEQRNPFSCPPARSTPASAPA